MTKEEITQSIVDGLVPQSTKDLISQGVDQAVELGKSQGGGGLTQADIDAAVAAQKATDDAALQASQAADQAALEQVKSDMQKQIDDLKAQLTDVQTKLGADESVIQGLKGSIDKLQAVLDVLKGL